MSGHMTVHLYDVRRHSSPPIDQIFNSIMNQPLHQRMRKIANTDIRLEECLSPHSAVNSTPYWLMDFTNIRLKNGPGKANLLAPMTGFNIGPNEGFGEETAVLYDAQYRVLIIQYNHHGPRASSICSYFNSFDPSCTHDYSLTIRVDNNTATKFNGKRILKKVTIQITPPKISAQMRNGGTSLSKALQISDELDAESIELTISAGRSSGSRLNLDKTKRFIDNVKQQLGVKGAVGRLSVTGQTMQGTPVESIDLLEEKIEAEIDNLTLGSDLRYTRDSRWNALIRARNGWSSII